MTDNDLLAAYAESKNQSAFRELMERYSGLVYASALRRTGSPEMAAEGLQNVFIALARKAGKLKSHPVLAGWLHRATMTESAHLLSKDSRRKQKMKEYQAHQQIAENANAIDDSIPTLDEAIDKLPHADRDLILLRFFEHKSYREVAIVLGKSEAASRKQGERALGKLGAILRRKGVVASASVLTVALVAQLGKTAPAGITSAASKAVISSITTGGAAPAILTSTVSIMALTNSKLTPVLAAIALLAISGTAFWAGRERAHARLATQMSAAPIQVSVAIGANANSEDDASRPEERGLTTAQLRRLLMLAARDHDRLDLDSAASYQLDVRLRQIPTGQLPFALQMVSKMPGGFVNHHGIAQKLLQFWSEHDGPNAMAFAYQHLDAKQLKDTADSILKPWAERDPSAAIAWFRASLDSDVAEGIVSIAEKESQLRIIFSGWAQKAAPTAIAEFRKLTSADERPHALTGITDSLVTPGFRNEVLDFVLEIEDQESRRDAIVRATGVLGVSAPEEAVAWIDRTDLSQDEMRYAAGGLYNSWQLGGDPKAAAEWFAGNSQSNEDLVDRLNTIVSNWANRNPDALNEWLNEIDFDAEMDDAVAAIALQFDHHGKRDLALEWSLKITDSRRQFAELQTKLHNWVKHDPDAAKQWFESAPLSSEVSEAIREEMKWETQ